MPTHRNFPQSNQAATALAIMRATCTVNLYQAAVFEPESLALQATALAVMQYPAQLLLK
ncbi:hypothetical protein T11_2066 [Trichinella zimbabwensis]|uniref:Uncharacterized protein n=1 Tax=Trichinella zimbabwensis TaxID=268475 RepID=A0A0V1HSZ9_9BILA|nr:hypothetical protein T11_2066 [Trichinella zimbabwensis]